MSQLNIAENIIRLRREKKMTQEQLAEFVGVTKASVSKWETKQTTPDILILPQLATIFDVTIDQLLGYEPQLSKEQIHKIYREFVAGFSKYDFDVMMEKTRKYVKQYYACYPFLSQICVLWMNHVNLAGSPEKQIEVLKSIYDLCQHIETNCRDVRLCNDAVEFRACACLLLGRIQESIEILEGTTKTHRLMNQGNSLLGQAYILSGNMEKAESFLQVNLYVGVLTLLGNSSRYLMVHRENLSVCEETIRRIEQVMEAYQVKTLHPNDSAAFEYQAVLCYLHHQEKEKAKEHVRSYIACLQKLFEPEEFQLRGDTYFTRIEEWFEEMDIGAVPLREKNLVLEDVILSLQQPEFQLLEGDTEFEYLKKKVEEMRK